MVFELAHHEPLGRKVESVPFNECCVSWRYCILVKGALEGFGINSLLALLHLFLAFNALVDKSANCGEDGGNDEDPGRKPTEFDQCADFLCSLGGKGTGLGSTFGNLARDFREALERLFRDLRQTLDEFAGGLST